MRERHLAEGIGPTPASFVRGMDLCPTHAWDIAGEEVDNDRCRVTVCSTPMDQAWEDYGEGVAARLFWEESYPALARGYDPTFTADLPQLRWRGDDATTLVVSRA